MQILHKSDSRDSYKNLLGGGRGCIRLDLAVKFSSLKKKKDWLSELMFLIFLTSKTIVTLLFRKEKNNKLTGLLSEHLLNN